jgi:hypothetical protein
MRVHERVQPVERLHRSRLLLRSLSKRRVSDVTFGDANRW